MRAFLTYHVQKQRFEQDLNANLSDLTKRFANHVLELTEP